MARLSMQEGASCRPELIEQKEGDEPLVEIRGGVHPSLAHLTSDSFIPNDTVRGGGAKLVERAVRVWVGGVYRV